MYFSLITSFDGIRSFYGEIPEIDDASPDSYEYYEWDLSDQEMLAEDFVRPINDHCGSILDIYDVDYFNAYNCDQCARLRDWLIDRLRRPCPQRLCEMYGVLLNYASRAAELGTGVVVEL